MPMLANQKNHFIPMFGRPRNAYMSEDILHAVADILVLHPSKQC